MKLFDKRPLALILSITVGGFVIFSFSSESIRLMLLIFSVLLGFFSLLLSRERKTKIFISAVSLALLFSMLLSDFYFNHYFDISNASDEEIEIEAVVYDLEYTDYSATLLMKSRKIEGRDVKRDLVGYINKSETLSIDIGSVIVFKSTLKEFTPESRAYYYSRGISASVGEIESLKVIAQNEAPMISHLADFRKILMRRAVMLSDYETGTLTAALLLGERSFLSGNVSLDFKAVGISHILALSGMHLTILATGIAFFLTALGVNKKWRVVIIIIITLLYMGLTGFSASIMRAGIMLIISSVLFLLSSTHDPLTSLVISVVLILLFTPYAIYDLSLWLSAFATLGIIAFTELKLFEKTSNRFVFRLLNFLTKSLLASIFAISATLPFTAVVFDSISPLGPITTLIFGLPTEIIMYLGSFMLLFGDIIPFGIILSPIVKGTLYLVNAIANIPGTLSSTRFPVITVLALLFALVFFLFLVLNVKRKRLALCIVMTLYVTVFSSSHLMTVMAESHDEINYLNENSADAFIIKSDSETCLIDSSSQTANISYTWLDELSRRNIVRLDKYYLTHYSRKTEAAVETVISKIKTNELCLPSPQNPSESSILQNLIRLADSYKIKISLISLGKTFDIGSFEVTQFYGTPYGEGTSMTGLTIRANDKKHLYVSSGMYEGKTKALTLDEMKTSYTVIFGGHGRKYSEATEFDKKFSKIWVIILGSNNLVLSDSAREYYKLCGGEIYTSPTAIDVLR